MDILSLCRRMVMLFFCVACGFCAANCPCGALKIVKWEDVAAAMA